MADEATVNVPATESSSVPPSGEEQSAAAVSDPADQSAGIAEGDAYNPSLDADPWASLGTETPDEAAKTDDAEPAEKPAGAVKTDGKETEEKKQDSTEEKSLEDQVLEEAFGEKKPDDKEKPADEATKDEDLDKLDPKEMIERQKNASSRAWAARNSKRAEIVKEFAYSDKPITEIATKFKELNETRYTEFAQHAAHELVDTNPEATFQRAFVVSMLKQNPFWNPKTATIPTLEDVLSGSFAKTNGNGTQPLTNEVAMPDGLAAQVKALDDTLGFDWRDPANDSEFYDDRELAIGKAVREFEAEYKKLASKPQPEAPKAEQPTEAKPEGMPAEQQEKVRVELDTAVNNYRASIEAKILPWIAKNTGLEISKDDSPEITAFKENLMLHYRGTDYQRANNLPSDFENFATRESSVAGQLEEVYTRIVDHQLKASLAKLEGKPADAAKHNAEAEAERVSVLALLGEANKEFKTQRIEPHMKLIGTLSNSLTHKTHEASQRIEIVSNGGDLSRSPAPAKDYDTADDVWNSMADEAKEEDRLRAA